MVERFFFSVNDKVGSSSANSPSITLLSGPPSCGKTSLLFQFAYNCASSSSSGNRHVVFICNRRCLETNPPFLSPGVDPSSDLLQHIQMKYVDGEEGIKKYFAAFHLQETFPYAIIIDDFGELFNERICQEKYASPRGRDLAMVRTLALCQDALMHAKKSSGCACELLLGDTHHGDSPRLLYIYKRWVSSIFTIKGDGCGSFLLKGSERSGGVNGNGNGRKMATAKYSISLQHLHLHGITEDTSSVM